MVFRINGPKLYNEYTVVAYSFHFDDVRLNWRTTVLHIVEHPKHCPNLRKFSLVCLHGMDCYSQTTSSTKCTALSTSAGPRVLKQSSSYVAHVHHFHTHKHDIQVPIHFQYTPSLQSTIPFMRNCTLVKSCKRERKPLMPRPSLHPWGISTPPRCRMASPSAKRTETGEATGSTTTCYGCYGQTTIAATATTIQTSPFWELQVDLSCNFAHTGDPSFFVTASWSSTACRNMQQKTQEKLTTKKLHLRCCSWKRLPGCWCLYHTFTSICRIWFEAKKLDRPVHLNWPVVSPTWISPHGKGKGELLSSAEWQWQGCTLISCYTCRDFMYFICIHCCKLQMTDQYIKQMCLSWHLQVPKVPNAVCGRKRFSVLMSQKNFRLKVGCWESQAELFGNINAVINQQKHFKHKVQ